MIKCFHLRGQSRTKGALQNTLVWLSVYIQLLIPYENTTDLNTATDATPTALGKIKSP